MLVPVPGRAKYDVWPAIVLMIDGEPRAGTATRPEKPRVGQKAKEQPAQASA